MSRLCAILLIACASATAQRSGPYPAGPDRDIEAALGAALVDDIRRLSTAVDSPLALEYVDRLGARLAEQLGTHPETFTFAIVAESLGGRSHEPLWCPGGYIFVPAALFLETANESQFAAMLAHSMAHIAEHHGIPKPIISPNGSAAKIPLVFIGGCGDAARLPDAIARSQRGYEFEADQEALRVTGASGYSPSALGQYLSRMLADRPGRAERLARLGPFEGIPAAASSSEFAAAQAEIRSLLPPREHPMPSLRKTPSLRRPDGNRKFPATDLPEAVF